MRLLRIPFIMLGLILGLIVILIIECNAQEAFQMSLPDFYNSAAIGRIGRGQIKEILYSPDSKLLAVGSSIGKWLYDAESGTEQLIIVKIH